MENFTNLEKTVKELLYKVSNNDAVGDWLYLQFETLDLESRDILSEVYSNQDYCDALGINREKMKERDYNKLKVFSIALSKYGKDIKLPQL